MLPPELLHGVRSFIDQAASQADERDTDQNGSHFANPITLRYVLVDHPRPPPASFILLLHPSTFFFIIHPSSSLGV